jgi:uncharacterized protein DUF4259
MVCGMGTWGSEPFDNDGAADWGNDLDDARPEDRAALVRSALTLDDGYLEVDEGQIAVAAAAVVAAVRCGTVPDSPYWPDFLTASEGLDLPDLRDLALTALDRIVGPESELHELWTEDGPSEEWDAQITALRASLQ